MSNTKTIAPIAQNQTNQCTITPPWILNKSEYHPLVCTFEPLVNGQQAFGAVYRAIETAKKSVCIICWGFQPSMYFVRDGASLPIGALLEKKAEEEGVQVRILCYAFEITTAAIGPDFVQRYVNVTGYEKGLNESNTPGRHDFRIQDRPPTSTDEQYRRDVRWYAFYDENQEIEDVAWKKIKGMFGDKKAKNLKFASRGFSSADRARIGTQTFEDKGLSAATKATLAATPSHHQKMVLVDYEDPKRAVGFVMGHNMLDEYWDTDEHTSQRNFHLHRRPEPEPHKRANGAQPRQDLSSRVTGPILGDLFANFSQAWKDETGEALPKANFSKYPLRDLSHRIVLGQLLRTQPQYGVEDIKKLYLQAVNNATQYIFIENQYFRWPPLAEKIKAAAKAQTGGGRAPNKHGYLHLFVLTNSSDSGMGAGVVNTYRMLDSLGRADTIPSVARQERAVETKSQLVSTRCEVVDQRKKVSNLGFAVRQNPNSPLAKQYAQESEKLKALEAKQKAEQQKLDDLQNGKTEIKEEEVPGLKIHVCTLVAPDTPDGQPWMDVYIHSKLMLIDDTFTTLGSANINTRSMEVDTELNIAHHKPEMTYALRKKLWNLHTKGQGAQDDPAEAFEMWAKVIQRNKDQRRTKRHPIASLIEFHRGSPERKNMD